ncbi:MAG TPA: Fur family transcriptional regulator [Candidatus Saccharimonadales bacterium]|nr:Fur family transcriptional regulator [Candidatus Saccharimonadales bacterium]
MISSRENFKKILKEQGYHATKARLVVFEALLGQEPLSMHALVVRTTGVNRASVYRAITLFESLGIVQRLNTGWKYKLELTDKFNEHHHHLTCTQCGRTVMLNETELEEIITRLAATHHFTPASHQIEVQGLCSQCQK